MTGKQTSTNMRFVAICLIGLLVAACQSTTGSLKPESMKIEDARRISADFKIANFIAPPRSANDLRKLFEAAKPVPNNCSQQIKERWRKQSLALERLESAEAGDARKGAASALGADAENLMAVGRFDRAIQLLEDAASTYVPGQGGRVTQAGLISRLARLYARLGDLVEADFYVIEFEELWDHPGLQEWKGLKQWKSQTASMSAELAFARGNLPLAEQQFRSAILASGGSQGTYGNISEADMRAGLGRSLILQGRLPEAEAAAREALVSLGITERDLTSYLPGYSGRNAAPVVVLAAVYLEQGRSQDAESIARAAINMFEHECSAPESLGLTAARKTLVQVLAEQGKWQELLRETGKAKDALKQYPDLYRRKFGETLERIEAEFLVGDTDIARSLLEKIRGPAAAEHGEGSYQVAEIDALVALSVARRNASGEALPSLSKAITALLTKNANPAVGVTGRRGRIIDAYVRTLRAVVEKGQRAVSGIDAVAEMLRVTAFHREAKVGRALSAGYLRTTVSDPELSKLIRKEQDIAEESRAVGDRLAYVSRAPGKEKTLGSVSSLRERLKPLRLARQSLRAEVLKRFPAFAELTAPKPMTVEAMRSKLTAGQSLVVFHVADDVTYAWALPARSDGDIAFALIPIGRSALTDDIEELRDAVEPGLLRSLGDIPRFDVALAHALYKKLLAPVKDGWKDARELVVVADGPLGMLPLSMLATKPKRAGDDGKLLFSGYRQVAWLGREVGVTYLPSVNALKSLGRGKAKVRQSTQVASRGFSLRRAPLTREVDSAELSRLPRLPDTGDEILAIAKSMGADPAKDIYLGERASERNVKSVDLSVYSVLSFATHGLVPGDLNGLDQPALALSAPEVTGEKDDDGLLTMNEILGLKLNADFAVLSACNTAAADGKGAEAVSGLGRAFFYAGARALLVSNWPVHSAATTDLMSRMFRSLANDNSLTRTEALRRTKLRQIDRGGHEIDGKMAFSYAHPIFWAPFTVVGDGGSAAPRHGS